MKLPKESIEAQARHLAKNPQAMLSAQAAIYTMIGGGMLGQSAVNQPGDFYIDSRVGPLPYSKRDILQAVSILAVAYDMAPGTERDFPLVNLGVF